MGSWGAVGAISISGDKARLGTQAAQRVLLFRLYAETLVLPHQGLDPRQTPWLAQHWSFSFPFPLLLQNSLRNQWIKKWGRMTVPAYVVSVTQITTISAVPKVTATEESWVGWEQMIIMALDKLPAAQRDKSAACSYLNLRHPGFQELPLSCMIQQTSSQDLRWINNSLKCVLPVVAPVPRSACLSLWHCVNVHSTIQSCFFLD